jgi:hypothetical protein
VRTNASAYIGKQDEAAALADEDREKPVDESHKQKQALELALLDSAST